MSEKTREQAWGVLSEFTKNESLLKHALAVEAAMRHYARRLGEGEELWGIVGLLHDFDYERYPDPADHPLKGEEILRERGWPDEITYAITTHADHAGRPRTSRLHRYLFACDELCGFLTACALVQPDKSIHSVTVESVKKKLKTKGFARAVRREEILKGIDELGLDLDEHIGEVIAAMRGVAASLGLAGRAAGGGGSSEAAIP
ncbi:MAG: HDIG domain-containing metalloprotein [Planctomycetota bacterium]